MAKGQGRRAQVAPRQLFPIRALWCGPRNLGGVDCNEVCRCEDGYEYAVKRSVPNKFVAHSEWFCSRLAQHVNIRHIQFNQVRHTDGDTWFGSQFMNGEVKDWWLSVDFSDIVEDWSRIYSFDLFINNDDRHLGNFFVVKLPEGHRAHAIDYSRAWMCGIFPPPPLPMDPTCNTILAHRYIRQQFKPVFNLSAANEVLDRIDSIKLHEIRRIITDQDKNWLTQAEISATMQWWKANAKDRTQSIRLGMQNGTFF
jgi:hypothetical protein